MRQLLAESVVLAVLGGAAGLAVPMWGLRLFMHATPLGALQTAGVSLDAAVLAFTTGLALLTGVAFGIAPALAVSNPNVTEGLKSGSGQTGTPAHRARLRESLVVAELAAALVLLIGAGLLTRSLLELLAIDPGFRPDHVVGVRLGRLSKGWFLQGRARSAFYEVMLERLAALPGVTSVALGDWLPLGGFAGSATVRVDDAPPTRDGGRDAGLSAISADYFKTLGVAVIAGRDFTAADRVDAAPGAIVNAAFARVFTLESELARSAAPRRDNAILLGSFAAVALALAAVGLAGVIAGLVARRTHEIGVRMALGAERGDVLRLIVRQAARLVAIGGVLGLVSAVSLHRALRSLLFRVTPMDPATFLIVPLVLATVAFLAAAIPARRATRVQPLVGPRAE